MNFVRVSSPLKLRNTSYLYPGEEEEEGQEGEAFSLSIKAIEKGFDRCGILISEETKEMENGERQEKTKLTPHGSGLLF